MKTLKEFIEQFNEVHSTFIPPNVLYKNEITFEVVIEGKNKKDAKAEAIKKIKQSGVNINNIKIKLERHLLVDKENDDYSWTVRVQGDNQILNQIRKYTDRGIA